MNSLVILLDGNVEASRNLLADIGIASENGVTVTKDGLEFTLLTERTSQVAACPNFGGCPWAFCWGTNRAEHLPFPKSWEEIRAWKEALDAEPIIPLEVPHVGSV